MHDDMHADEEAEAASPPAARPRSRVRTAARWAGRAAAPLLVGALVFGAVTSAAGVETGTDAGSGAADVGDAQPVHYLEECEGEGCSNEEINELWNSFQSECFQEQCWTEEVFELSGGARYHSEPYHPETRVGALFHAFRHRLGRQFQDPQMRVGQTDDFWNWLVQLVDGQVITTPRIPCDPYCG